MNQSEANCEFFLLEKTLTKKRIVRAFSIFNQKNENKDESKL